MKKYIFNPLAIVIGLMILAPTVYAATPPLGAVVRDLIARITTIETDIDTLETDVSTLQTDLSTVQSDIDNIETELETTVGDIAFYFDQSGSLFVLKTDGTAWTYQGSGWLADTSHDAPIDVEDIVSWSHYGLLDTSGDTWYYNGSWTNIGAP